jgi:nucleotide-binding universal stress UspA family protein
VRFREILFPVDFSDRCRATAPFVSAAARRNGAKVTLAHFIDLNWYGTPEAPCQPDMSVAGMIQEAEENLALFAYDLLPGVNTTNVAEAGDPGSGISGLARDAGIDLIMMPTRGRGRFTSMVLGSVAAKVLHDAECPVWTAAHAESSAYPAGTEWRNIVCAIETTPDALCLIRHAGEMAAAYGSSVSLVHAVPASPETVPEKYFDQNFDAFVKDFARQSIDAMQKEAGTRFPLSVDAGSVSAVVAEAARRRQADLVLIGRGVLPHFAGGLRTHVFSIIPDAPCPVLSI